MNGESFDLIRREPLDAFQHENPDFLKEQIITYIGNKRSLLDFIGCGVEKVEKRLGRSKLIVADVFAGSGVVSRYLKRHAEELYCNDLEPYSACINSCYLTNRSEVDFARLQAELEFLRREIKMRWSPGFITELYAPKDDEHIQKGERVFFTRRNAIYIDTARQIIDELPEEDRKYFLAPLLYEASVHNNTSGVFKGFYKNRKGVGQFGGQGRNALARIMSDIEISLPVFSAYECKTTVSQLESMAAIKSFPELDVAYLDPPYNQHPYGSNYFMLNLILENKRPAALSEVSGIPHEWNRSAYNSAKQAKEKLFTVIRECPAKYILISYNSEGIIKYDEIMEYLDTMGSTQSIEAEYHTFRGSRNLKKRPKKVKEFLFLLEKK